MTPRVWTMTITAPVVWLTANDRRNTFTQARLIKRWRVASFIAAKHHKLPKDLDKVEIAGVARFRGRPPVRESGNLHPTMKAVVDGLGPERVIRRNNLARVSVGYGLVPDDSDKHVVGPFIEIGDPLPDRVYAGPGELIVTITEVLG